MGVPPPPTTSSWASGAVELPHLPHDHLDRPGDGDGEQRPHEPAEEPAHQVADVGPHQDGDEHEERVDAHRPAHDDGVEDVVLDLGVGQEDHGEDDEGAERVRQREQGRGDPGQRPADHGQEVEERHPQRPQQRVGHAQRQQRHEDHQSGDDRRDEVAEHVAGDRPVHLPCDPRESGGALGRDEPQDAAAHLGPLEQEQQDEDEHDEDVEAEREGAGAELQRRLGEVRGVVLELGQVLVHPVLHVVLASRGGRSTPCRARRSSRSWAAWR